MFALYHNYSEYVCIIKERKKKCPHIEEFDDKCDEHLLEIPGHFFLCDQQTVDYRESPNLRAHDQNERVEMCDVVRRVGV